MMPKKALPELTKEEMRLWDILKRAVDVRRPYTRVNEVARLQYHGSPDFYATGSDLTIPPPNWEAFRTDCLNTAGRLISGEPRPSARNVPNKPEFEETAKFINELLRTNLSKSSFRGVLTNQTLDVSRYGTGWIYLDDEDKLRHWSWFDCYFDNALGKMYDIYGTSRYMFLRVLTNKDTFEAKTGIDTKKTVAECVNEGESIGLPGRQVAGVDIWQRLATYRENNTLVQDAAHGMLTAGYSEGGQYKTSLAQDGLVEWWISFERKPETENWVRRFIYGGHFFDIEEFDDWDEAPTLFGYSWDDDGEQVYSPGAYVHSEKNQAFGNWLLMRAGMAVDLVTDPMLINPMDSGLDDGVGARLVDSGKECRPTSKNTAPEYAKYPTFPNQWIDFFGTVTQVWQDSAGQQDTRSGKVPSSEASGILVQELEKLGNFRDLPLAAKRDEMLSDIGRRLATRLVKRIVVKAEQDMAAKNAEIEASNQVKFEFNEGVIFRGGSEQDLLEPQPSVDIFQFLPPELIIWEKTEIGDIPVRAITPEDIREHMNFDFQITPPLTKEERYNALTSAINVFFPIVAPLYPESPKIAMDASIDLAATATSTRELAEEMRAKIQEGDVQYKTFLEQLQGEN